MSLYHIVIVEQDSRYLQQMMYYITSHPPRYIQIEFYEQIYAALQNQNSKHPYTLLICKNEMDYYLDMRNDINCLPEEIYIFSDSLELGRFQEFGWIHKYQSIELILSQIIEIVWTKRSCPIMRQIHPARFCSVFPAHVFSGDSLLGLQMALKSTRDEKTLYLPLNQLSILDLITGKRPSKSLSDVLAACYEGDIERMLPILDAAVMRYENIEILMPVSDPMHLLEITPETWEAFFYQLKTHGTYDLIIIETDILFPGIKVVFSACEQIYYSRKDGKEDSYREQKFLDWIAGIKESSDVFELVPIQISSQIETIFLKEAPDQIRYFDVTDRLNINHKEPYKCGKEQNE